MDIIELKDRAGIIEDVKLNNVYVQFKTLLGELRKKTLPGNITESINADINAIDASTATGNDLKKIIKQKQTAIIKLVEKELKIVPKAYYRNLWLAVGMSAFGLPIGVVFGLSMGNMGLLAIGLPIGMAIGIGVGTSMDNKAAAEGRQLDVEIKY